MPSKKSNIPEAKNTDRYCFKIPLQGHQHSNTTTKKIQAGQQVWNMFFHLCDLFLIKKAIIRLENDG
jgi:hypothetical protein